MEPDSPLRSERSPLRPLVPGDALDLAAVLPATGEAVGLHRSSGRLEARSEPSALVLERQAGG